MNNTASGREKKKKRKEKQIFESNSWQVGDWTPIATPAIWPVISQWNKRNQFPVEFRINWEWNMKFQWKRS